MYFTTCNCVAARVERVEKVALKHLILQLQDCSRSVKDNTSSILQTDQPPASSSVPPLYLASPQNIMPIYYILFLDKMNEFVVTRDTFCGHTIIAS